MDPQGSGNKGHHYHAYQAKCQVVAAATATTGQFQPPPPPPSTINNSIIPSADRPLLFIFQQTKPNRSLASSQRDNSDHDDNNQLRGGGPNGFDGGYLADEIQAESIAFSRLSRGTVNLDGHLSRSSISIVIIHFQSRNDVRQQRLEATNSRPDSSEHLAPASASALPTEQVISLHFRCGPRIKSEPRVTVPRPRSSLKGSIRRQFSN